MHFGKPYGYSIDWWSVGTILYEIVYQCVISVLTPSVHLQLKAAPRRKVRKRYKPISWNLKRKTRTASLLNIMRLERCSLPGYWSEMLPNGSEVQMMDEGSRRILRHIHFSTGSIGRHAQRRDSCLHISQKYWVRYLTLDTRKLLTRAEDGGNDVGWT
jgi:hypothetical protein